MTSLIYVNSLAGLLIFTSLFVIYSKTVKSAAWGYAVQSLVLVLLFVCLASAVNSHELYTWAVAAFITKVILVPALILYMTKRLPAQSFVQHINQIGLIVVIAVIMIASYFVVEPINIAAVAHLKPALAISLSHFLLGLLCIVSQRHILKQVFGYCLMENGAHLTLAILANKAPELVEIGVSTDAIFAIVIMVVLVNRIYKKFGSLDAKELTELKG